MTRTTTQSVASGRQSRNRGTALLLSMIFIAISASMAVSLACLSNTNVQNSDDMHSANNARVAAESGLEIMQFLMRDLNLGGVGKTGTERITALRDHMQAKVAAEGMSSINLTAYPSASTPYIFISPVTLDSAMVQYITDEAGGILAENGSQDDDIFFIDLAAAQRRAQRLAAKARKKGLIGDNEVLSDNQIYNMIFAPGFSTQQIVTESANSKG